MDFNFHVGIEHILGIFVSILFTYIYLAMGGFLADVNRGFKASKTDKFLLGLDILLWPLTNLIRLVAVICLKIMTFKD